MASICDSFQRGISYLRISVTDRCNLRCTYCMPSDGVSMVSHTEILRFEEIFQIARAAVELGIDNIRITGGEPLARLHVEELIRMIASIDGIREISMTTNGTLLADKARILKEAGLHRVNVSLDTLNPQRFREITRNGELTDTLKGIEAAQNAGLNPIKINMVPMRGINDDEILDFARKTITDGWNVRFIELMPLQGNAEFIPSSELKNLIGSMGELKADKSVAGNGAAQYFRMPDAKGTIGFISPITESFCERCNRLRLSASGQLFPCLFSDKSFDLKTPIRNGAGIEYIKLLITEAVAAKPGNHHFATGSPENTKMSSIGG